MELAPNMEYRYIWPRGKVPSMIMAAFWVVAPWSLVEVYRRSRGACCLHHLIALVLEAASTYEASVNFYHTTWRKNPEDIHLQEHNIFNLRHPVA
jgi:hypothetical protein